MILSRTVRRAAIVRRRRLGRGSGGCDRVWRPAVCRAACAGRRRRGGCCTCSGVCAVIACTLAVNWGTVKSLQGDRQR